MIDLRNFDFALCKKRNESRRIMKSSNKQYGKRLLILAFPIIMNNIIAQLQMIIDRIFWDMPTICI